MHSRNHDVFNNFSGPASFNPLEAYGGSSSQIKSKIS